ncbi:rRNA maturation RNase YbeY [hot springs metagenome]|uniref:rRNA maturation RNase YbeY n=1 Tax=hot springs metagenome TaxID=433727 RepID=A0A5J4L3Y6_9ZZZZ
MEITIKNNQRLMRVNQRRVKQILKRSLQYLKDSGKLDSLFVAHYPLLEISVFFVNDRKMRELNLQYREKDKTTDVLSFPQIAFSNKRQASGIKVQSSKLKKRLSAFSLQAFDSRRMMLLGDIVINIPQAKRQAKEHGFAFYEEVAWLLIHGLLHLLGYDHEKNKYQAKKMREMEKQLLSCFKS